MPLQKRSKAGVTDKPAGVAASDPRFSQFTTDPRFRLPSKKHARTKVDKRFSRMLEDDDFSNTASVDRYGRKLDSSSKKKALRRLYEPEEEGDNGSSDNEVSEDDVAEGDSEVSVEDDETILKELKRVENYDPARGGGFESSSDEDEDSEEEEDGVEAEVDEEQFPDMADEQTGVPMGDVTNRIAVVNLDWDNINSSDLMAVFSSFVPAGGRIAKVSVYQSEFGKERMEREEMEGPPPEIFGRKTQASDDEDDDEALSSGDDGDEEIKKSLLQEDDGKDFDSAALRQYQLERLRYYYAVVICSDNTTAEKLYELTDGTEYLNSANFLDMRFIPDGTEFDEAPRDECTSVPSGYKPTEFVTDALQHSKVKLTWDAEDAGRKDAIKKAFGGSRNDINENDLKAYLGSDTSDDEDESDVGQDTEAAPKLSKKELARQKMRAALGLGEEPTKSSKASKNGPVGDMEITFTAGLTAGDNGGVFQNKPIIEETTAEAYKRKEKERKARRKEKARAIREGRDLDATKPTDVAETAEDLGFNDPFFGSDEEAKTKAAKSIKKEERQKKREAKEAEAAEKASHKAELELLMRDDANEMKRLDHFDINEIARVEKNKKKRSKSKKYAKELEVEGGKRGGLQESFEMNVQDPRFKAVFDSHEFAIDPSNPKFKGTEGMKKLLEEGRKKRKHDGYEGELEEAVDSKKVKKSTTTQESDDLQSLVNKVKRKAKK